MKCLNILSFKKHFENPLFEKICYFFVVIQGEYEKKNIINFIKKHFDKKNYNFTTFFDKKNVDEIINTYQSLYIFKQDPFCIIENIQDINKKDLQKLGNFIKNNDVKMILTSNAKSDSSLLYSIVEKKGLVLDLSREKIWDKEKRFNDFIVEKCMTFQKNISSVVIQAILEKVGLDLAAIDQEVNKLIAFVGDKKTIELEDVEKICVNSIQNTIWKISENIVWGKSLFENSLIDVSYFHSLIVSIRYQLQMGLKMATLIENNKSHELSQHFPKIYPRALEKKKEIALRRTSAFFKKALIDLFEIDLISKTSNVNIKFLLDLLKSKLYYDACSTS